jgi:hypothetical protein
LGRYQIFFYNKIWIKNIFSWLNKQLICYVLIFVNW